MTNFPLWNPQRATKYRFNNSDFKIRLSAIRNSSSAFIKRNDVRVVIFTKDMFKCVSCGSKDNLTIDHIISIYRCAVGEYPIEKLNTIVNLQSLCLKCNCSKLP